MGWVDPHVLSVSEGLKLYAGDDTRLMERDIMVLMASGR